MSYSPVRIAGNQTGLVRNRQEFLLPNDAYPVLENAYLFREQMKRKLGVEGIGRFRRVFTTVSIGNSSASPWTFTLFSTVSPAITETNAELELGTVVIVMGGVTFTDQGDGTLTSSTPGNSGVINYITSVITLTTTVGASTAATASFNYYPLLPAMGIRNKDITSLNSQLTIGFDTTYAYIPNGSDNTWREFLPGTTWTGDDDNFFWHTNFWNDPVGRLFWVTNFSGTGGDPIRYTNGATWFDFSPTINAAADVLAQCLCIVPFRGRLVVFNTYEGQDLATSVNYGNRIRWAAIGNPVPLDDYQPWLDDTRGLGGFLDIPTTEQIVSVGFVRDNVVIYCSRSTWQLRYTGRSIAPFQIEKVNSELGAESTFSTVQFDTSLVGIGDKGIVECDSFQSTRIDVKIPDIVFSFNASNSGLTRIQSARDFRSRLAYWTYPLQDTTTYEITYPNRRLVRNYENDSWAVFTDSLTALGTYFPTSGRTWANTKIPWEECNFPWNRKPEAIPDIIGGNQQGFVFILDSINGNDPSLSVRGITGNSSTNQPTVINSPNHNLATGQIIQITDIAGTPSNNYTSLNMGIFYVITGDLTGNNQEDNFQLWVYNPSKDNFDIPQLDVAQTYLGGGQIAVRDNFYIQSKKFNFIDEGQSIQLGYIDLLMSATTAGSIALNIFANYNDSNPVNISPSNSDPVTQMPDTFFNQKIITYNPNTPGVQGTKYMHRVFCAVRANFITIVYTLNNAQMVSDAQTSTVEIDAQILYMRRAGRLTNR